MINIKPLISVIIPAYNVEKYINETLDSVLNQTYQNFEILIADDGSSDKTKEIIDSYKDPRIKIYHNENNVGKTNTVKKLLKLCSGDLYTIHDSDDISTLNRFEKIIDTFIENPEYGMIGSRTEIIAENGTFIDFNNLPLTNEEIKNNIKFRNSFNGSAVIVKKEFINKVGGYRDYFENKGCQDYDWTYLISDLTKTMNIEEPLYKYRQLSTSRSKRINPERIVSDKIVQFLGKERRDNNGVDSLMSENIEKVESKLKELTKPYYKDTSLIYREHASIAMYNKMYKRAIKVSITAIKNNPSKLINWRTLFYCIRKSLIKGLK